ncbi:hypothetical protein RRG08_057534 [Elysia crispata]|uniref:Uncharacterized protein n=1 Tax=Elysia crispata TaxID=231223 RepID=A0AAE1EAC5_9GAST|nr:hypothetical protein RRG08_057534 [Elysia crispata]
MVNLDVTRSDTGAVSLTSGQVDRGVRILVKAPIWTLRNVAPARAGASGQPGVDVPRTPDSMTLTLGIALREMARRYQEHSSKLDPEVQL